jgi:hypothetical protein
MYEVYNIRPFIERVGGDLKGLFQVSISKKPYKCCSYADGGWTERLEYGCGQDA